jgi:hypothetical protein
MLQLSPSNHPLFPDSAGYILGSDYGFSLAGGGAMTVPAGFWFNCASIPAVLWAVIYSPFDPRIITGALVHDWLYTSHVTDRRTSDDTLMQYAAIGGGSRAKVAAIGAGVKTFGGAFWGHNENDQKYITALTNDIKSSGRNLRQYGLG